MHKRGGTTGLDNYMSISVLPYIHNLFIEIITKRLTGKSDQYQPPEEADQGTVQTITLKF